MAVSFVSLAQASTEAPHSLGQCFFYKKKQKKTQKGFKNSHKVLKHIGAGKKKKKSKKNKRKKRKTFKKK